MEMTGFPFWKIYYDGIEMPKIAGFLSEAQEFVSSHEIQSIKFYVNVMLTVPGKGGTEKEFGQREMTKEELLSAKQAWVEERMKEAGKEANDYYFPFDK
jgi:hypothetical protein